MRPRKEKFVEWARWIAAQISRPQESGSRLRKNRRFLLGWTCGRAHLPGALGYQDALRAGIGCQAWEIRLLLVASAAERMTCSRVSRAIATASCFSGAARSSLVKRKPE